MLGDSQYCRAREGSEFSGNDIKRIAERSCMQIGDMGMFHFLGSPNLATAASRCPTVLSLEILIPLLPWKRFSTHGLTLFTSIPRVPDPLAVFDEMIAVAQYAASELSGRTA